MQLNTLSLLAVLIWTNSFLLSFRKLERRPMGCSVGSKPEWGNSAGILFNFFLSSIPIIFQDQHYRSVTKRDFSQHDSTATLNNYIQSRVSYLLNLFCEITSYNLGCPQNSMCRKGYVIFTQRTRSCPNAVQCSFCFSIPENKNLILQVFDQLQQVIFKQWSKRYLSLSNTKSSSRGVICCDACSILICIFV